MRKPKLIMLLSIAVFPLLVWMIAMSDTDASIVAKVGLTTTVLIAAAISIMCSWALVMFADEYRDG